MPPSVTNGIKEVLLFRSGVIQNLWLSPVASVVTVATNPDTHSVVSSSLRTRTALGVISDSEISGPGRQAAGFADTPQELSLIHI